MARHRINSHSLSVGEELHKFKDLKTGKNIALKIVSYYPFPDGFLAICTDKVDNSYLLVKKDLKYNFIDYIVSNTLHPENTILVMDKTSKEIGNLKKINTIQTIPLSHIAKEKLQKKLQHVLDIYTQDDATIFRNIVTKLIFGDANINLDELFFSKSQSGQKAVTQLNFGKCFNISILDQTSSITFKGMINSLGFHKKDTLEFQTLIETILKTLETYKYQNYQNRLTKSMMEYKTLINKALKKVNITRQLEKFPDFNLAWDFKGIQDIISNRATLNIGKCIEFLQDLIIELYIHNNDIKRLKAYLEKNPELQNKKINWCLDGAKAPIMEDIYMSITSYIRIYHPNNTKLLESVELIVERVEKGYRAHSEQKAPLNKGSSSLLKFA